MDRREPRLFRDGVAVRLSGRALDILVTLLDAAGEPVSNDALMGAVWSGVSVEENNLQVQISNLRKALSDGWIVHLPRRGYRIAVELSSRDSLSGHPSSRIAAAEFERRSGE